MRMEMPDERRLVHEMRIPFRWAGISALIGALGHTFLPQKPTPIPDRPRPLFD